MNWTIVAVGIYLVVLIAVCLRIIFETHSTNKTLAYLLFCFFIPVVGIAFYLTFGINYWRIKKYNTKKEQAVRLLEQLKSTIPDFDETSTGKVDKNAAEYTELAAMLIKDPGSPLTTNNRIQLLINGEQKFPVLMQAIREAKHHVHVEYYIYEYDETGTALVNLLIQKAEQGVQVRFIYDDFGSPSIKKKTEERMRKAGVEIHPFHKVHFYFLANRINYRNHRKIVVIDGRTGFVGGINVSDKYVNKSGPQFSGKLFWRDTHVRIDGPAVNYLQYLFMCDWNFCCPQPLTPTLDYFTGSVETACGTYVQIAASGPDSSQPAILFSILQAIYLAKEEILITTPYFIPGDSVLEALRVAAISGLTVKLLVPGKADSRIVNAASKSNYTDLLIAGVEIYLYQRGFVHAKTLVTDGRLTVAGTANMDHRSFELNFEVNAIIYDIKVAADMRNVFFKDLEDAVKIDKEAWVNRPWYRVLPERACRLFSPVL
ncbi:cardiolipin synthase [Ferruginibacter paludis]|uniref:cardiolipin synthase n=1 Tax=Ferruginibacter paludis TaxID=1310417 RepID=UPI0025B35932|nr:cardiolipin synthase [Ferruginibacter paludis]MDN3655980.1 cardiolipin synthase [Ferruginibacter paludis]